MSMFKVIAAWDQEAKVWYVSSSDVPGLSAEGDTLDDLLRELSVLIPELLALNGVIADEKEFNVPWELVSQHNNPARIAC